VIPITLIGPTKAMATEALVDSGADDTVFPEKIAAGIGIDLTNAPTVIAAGVGTAAVRIRLAKVILRLADNQEKHEWTAWIGFTSANLTHWLLGHQGVFEYFNVCFRDEREEVELETNSRYPGT